MLQHGLEMDLEKGGLVRTDAHRSGRRSTVPRLPEFPTGCRRSSHVVRRPACPREVVPTFVKFPTPKSASRLAVSRRNFSHGL